MKQNYNETKYIYVEIHLPNGLKRIVVEYVNRSEQKFEFFSELNICGPSKLVSGHRVGYKDRIINIWVETTSEIYGISYDNFPE